MIYCVKCKRKTDTVDIYKTKTKTGKPITKGKCKICGTIKCKFEKKMRMYPSWSIAINSDVRNLEFW